MSKEEFAEVNLNSPSGARHYIATFDWGNVERPTFIQTSSRRYYFDKLTDADAVKVANLIYRDLVCAIESKLAKSSGKHQ